VIAFHQTPMGKVFIERTMPDLVVQMKRIANSLDRLLDVVEREHAPAASVGAAPSTGHTSNEEKES
jgi:hypothetical protein